ncbi:Ca2+-binding RTX toxin-like protein [Microvirga lupini]|uniref:Ca2+-binding RTX toxin-like protein n=1 Tax=Microvirga lupini TaxID=420324 RepID=A0A7W4VKM5_9HYPH|nr:right-handed parallel beta-helix repeat-containing protein [Microvirga lupini]MBB3018480.1 Ca2+-binding RTX toxin-like protein [Microvirga lupini]
MAFITVEGPSTNPNEELAAAENVAKIKDAIAKANAEYLKNPQGGQVEVQLGAGTWVVTGDRTNASNGAIELLSGVKLSGSGDHQTIIKLENNYDAKINGIVRTDTVSVENVTITNLVIDGNRENNLGEQAGFICGIKEDGSGRKQSNITLDNIEVKNCTGYGINPHEITYNFTVTNSVAHNNGKDGFVADGVVGGVYSGNESYNNGRHGFNIQNASSNIILENNTAYDNGWGSTGGAGIVIQRGDIQRGNEAEIAHVTNVQIIGGEYYGNTREGILVKLSDAVTISGANVYENMRYGVRIEGSVNTALTDSFISNNSQEAIKKYDEVQIDLRSDYPDGNPDNDPSTNPLKNYYSTGTKILNNVINPEDARYAIREEPANIAAGPTGTEITGNVTSGTATDNADTLTGSAGIDTMAGLKGDDTYYVNKTDDVVTEKPDEGIDHVFASAKYTLGANVENLTLTGIAAINGYGNELDNVLTGNSAGNTLEGRDGADALLGGGGNDTLKGGTGNDSLDGGTGADSMVGGTGNDLYIVDNVGDFINEDVGGGYDRIFSSVTYTIADEAEELTLTGTADIAAYGDAVANILNGNAGNNILDGRGGADTMKGGLGNDTYYVDRAQDIVLEAAGEGIDTIISSVSIIASNPLAANVENLWLAGVATEGAGNQLNNLIVGNSANNKLYGYGGNDTLRGGDGNDLLDGGAGNNTLDGGAGNDTLNGSLGSADVAIYAGDRASYKITGTLANRSVSGSSEGTDTLLNIETLQFKDGMLVGDTWVANVVAPPPPPVNTGNQVVTRNGSIRSETLNGRDNIDDIINGKGGNDTINGRAGNDKLYGDIGNDKIYGGSGDDKVYGGSGNDYVHGGSGNDYANGGLGNDRVYGSLGNDRVYGGSGHDTVDGGSGNDRVYGDVGNDRLYGGTGDDVVNGGAGNDRLYGGAGSDAFVFNSKLGTASTDRKVNFDTVVDFNVRYDSFMLDNAVFKKLGSGTAANPTQLDKEFFVIGTKARERDDYLIYNKKTGVLSYDADGSGSKEAVEFAQLSKNLKLTYKDFFVI